ncbi:hypothetical protein C0993_002767 [Termitomyces sp. T159_Od127]|nr:hypothetical protein C0993_002767 [Termitomyces sp. T159_Od127]
MPSFRTILAFAITALAAVSSAAPLASGSTQVTQIVNIQDVVKDPLQNVDVSNIHVSALKAERRQVGQAAPLVNIKDTLDNLGQHVSVSEVDVEVLNIDHHKREEPQPIVAILLQAKAKLEATARKLNVIVKAKAEVDLDDLKVILDEVHATLLAAVASVKLIVGQSARFIFTHKGKTWTAAEVGTLLISVVVNVLYILSLILNVVFSASHKAALVQVSVVADVMVDLLQTIFVDLNVGIFAATRPQLIDALFKVWSSIELNDIVEVLKNGHL